MLKKRFKCSGEACVEKVEDIAARIIGIALVCALVVIYSSLSFL